MSILTICGRDRIGPFSPPVRLRLANPHLFRAFL